MYTEGLLPTLGPKSQEHAEDSFLTSPGWLSPASLLWVLGHQTPVMSPKLSTAFWVSQDLSQALGSIPCTQGGKFMGPSFSRGQPCSPTCGLCPVASGDWVDTLKFLGFLLLALLLFNWLLWEWVAVLTAH